MRLEVGDACERCKGTGKIGSKLERGNGIPRPCWECGGTGMVPAGPKGRRPK